MKKDTGCGLWKADRDLPNIEYGSMNVVYKHHMWTVKREMPSITCWECMVCIHQTLSSPSDYMYKHNIFYLSVQKNNPHWKTRNQILGSKNMSKFFAVINTKCLFIFLSQTSLYCAQLCFRCIWYHITKWIKYTQGKQGAGSACHQWWLSWHRDYSRPVFNNTV